MPGRNAWIARLSACLTLVASSTNLRAEERTGHVQIKAEDGVWIELDGFGLAVVEDPEGAVFRDVPAGTHRVVARREGFLSRQVVIQVRPGRVAVHRLHGWQPVGPEPTIPDGIGALVIRTFPVDATIKASRLGWERIEKSEAPFVASGIPVGRHKLTFCNVYKCIDYRAQILADQITSLFVDFELGAVHDRSREDAVRHTQETERCVKTKDPAACKSACQLEAALGLEGAACGTLGRDAAAALKQSLGRPVIPAARVVP